MKRLGLVLIVLLSLSANVLLAQDGNADGIPLFAKEICAYKAGIPVSQNCLDLMTEYPKPNLEFIEQDRATLSIYSFWKVGPGEVTKFDAPGGNAVGAIPAGFNFINAIDTNVADWLQIQGGEWISRTGTKYVEPSYFTGVLLPDGWSQPFAWVLDTTGIYASLTPGGESSKDSGYLTRRYDMVNIFAEAYDSDGWRWYMIGPNQWLKQTFVAKVQPAKRPEGVTERWIAVDLYEQSLIAYEGNKPVFATLVSSGLDNWDTEEGIYDIWARMPVDGMSGATGAPDAYALQSVPWVMYFNGSTSLHGTYWHDLFGYRRSHGCVNLSISDARWVFEWTAQSEPNENGEIVNNVHVFSSGEYGAPPNA